MADRHHSWTGVLLILFALLVLMCAIFLTIAQMRVVEIPEYSKEPKLQSAKNYLVAAYILGYIAAGISTVLAILYFGHVTWGIGTEIPHAILYVLLFILIVVAAVFGFIALNDINKLNLADAKGAHNWIWAAEISALVAAIVLIISGAWRAQYNISKPKEVKLDDTAKMQPKDDTYTAPSSYVAGAGKIPPAYMAPDLPLQTESTEKKLDISLDV